VTAPGTACDREGCGHPDRWHSVYGDHECIGFPLGTSRENRAACTCPAYQPAPTPTASETGGTVTAGAAAIQETAGSDAPVSDAPSPAEGTPTALVQAVALRKIANAALSVHYAEHLDGTDG
jgi:hypothetical protein